MPNLKILLFSNQCKQFETIGNCDKSLMVMIFYSSDAEWRTYGIN